MCPLHSSGILQVLANFKNLTLSTRSITSIMRRCMRSYLFMITLILVSFCVILLGSHGDLVITLEELTFFCIFHVTSHVTSKHSQSALATVCFRYLRAFEQVSRTEIFFLLLSSVPFLCCGLWPKKGIQF